jgi:hypothetical protein
MLLEFSIVTRIHPILLLVTKGGLAADKRAT